MAVEATTEVEIWRRPKKINLLALVSYSLLQTVFSKDVRLATNKTSQTDRQTDDRQTTHCTKGATDSTVGQKAFTKQ